jgi:hypothetical protein
MDQQSPLGQALNTPDLYTMIAEDRFRDAWMLLDKAMKGHPSLERDPHYVPFNETLAFCLLKDGSILQADAVFDRVRGAVRKNDYSQTARKLDVALRQEFLKVRHIAFPHLDSNNGDHRPTPRSPLRRKPNPGGRRETRREHPVPAEPAHDLDLTK